ncbi:DEAD/DEAH box helicase, partial [Shewanella sp. 10N.286.51.B7]
MPFAELELQTQLLQRLTELKYLQPSSIQQQAIPVILAGKDVLAGAQTGTGKTAAFALPILQQLLNQIEPATPHSAAPQSGSTQALILVPTRELSQQVSQSVESYAKLTPVKTVSVYGGVAIKAQIEAIKRGADIIVATPGRLLDLVRQQVLSLSDINYLVLDEAD